MERPFALVVIVFLLGLGPLSGIGVLAANPSDRPDVLEWDVRAVAPLPDEQGFAGAFSGVASDPGDPDGAGVLIVAGGANFPDGRPWDNCGGNISAAARELNIARSTLYRKMREFGLDDRS